MRTKVIAIIINLVILKSRSQGWDEEAQIGIWCSREREISRGGVITTEEDIFPSLLTSASVVAPVGRTMVIRDHPILIFDIDSPLGMSPSFGDGSCSGGGVFF